MMKQDVSSDPADGSQSFYGTRAIISEGSHAIQVEVAGAEIGYTYSANPDEGAIACVIERIV